MSTGLVFRFRFLSLVFAFSLALGVVGPVSLTPVLAQSDDLSQNDFDDLLDEAEENDPVFGPEDGELEHDPEIVTFANADIDVADFVAFANFINPYDGADQQFDMGIQFRSTTNEDDNAVFARFIVISTGVWAILESGNDEPVATGEYDDLDVERDGENDLTVFGEGELIHVAINGDYVGSAEVAFEGPGDIAVGTAFLGESFEDGAATEFEEFTVWSDEQDSGDRDDDENDENIDDDQGSDNQNTGTGDDDNDDQNTGTEDDDNSDDDQGNDDSDTGNDDDDEPVVEGTRYNSEVFAFHFTYGDEWELGSTSATDEVEFVQLTNGLSILQIVVGQIWDDQEHCVEALLGTVLTNFGEQGITGEATSSGTVELEDHPFPGTFGTEVEFVVDSGVDFPDTIIYVECGPAGTNEYLVGVVQIVSPEVYDDESELRKDIVATFNQEEDGGTDDPDNGDTDDSDNEDSGNTDNGGTELSANVVEGEDGLRFYTSPSFGLVVGILPGFTIEEDSVANGYDTLVVADSVGRATYSIFSSTNTAQGCIDSIMNNLNNDPSITQVQVLQTEDGEEIRDQGDGYALIAVYLTFNVNGETTDLGRFYSCVNDPVGDIMLVFAYETGADVFPDEIENIFTMIELILVE